MALSFAGQAYGATGTVKWFNDAKGYGFITPDGGGKELYVQYAAVQAGGLRSLAEGQRVEYELTQDPNDPQVARVRIVPTKLDSDLRRRRVFIRNEMGLDSRAATKFVQLAGK